MFLEGRVVVRPHERISNVPLQIDLKGYLISTELSTTPPVPLDLTEDTLAGFT